jgi:hypothetical protein
MLEACLEMMKTNPEGMKSVPEHQKVSNEETVPGMIRALKYRFGN